MATKFSLRVAYPLPLTLAVISLHWTPKVQCVYRKVFFSTWLNRETIEIMTSNSE